MKFDILSLIGISTSKISLLVTGLFITIFVLSLKELWYVRRRPRWRRLSPEHAAILEAARIQIDAERTIAPKITTPPVYTKP